MPPLLLAFVLLVVFGLGAMMWLSARQTLAKINAAMSLVGPWAKGRGYHLLPPTRLTRWGAGWGGFAVHGRRHDVEFKLEFDRSSHDNTPYTHVTAVPAWLPKASFFNVDKQRSSPEAWNESGLWVLAGPAEAASGLMARRSAISELVHVPLLRDVRAVDFAIPGAQRRECTITCDQWLTDAAQLDRLLESLSGLCTAQPRP